MDSLSLSIEINHQITGHQDSGTRILGGHAPKLWIPIFWACKKKCSPDERNTKKNTSFHQLLYTI